MARTTITTAEKLPHPGRVIPAATATERSIAIKLVARRRSRNHRSSRSLFRWPMGKSVQDPADNSVAAGNTKDE